ncbi:MAG: excinuclease ABC subunit UvrA [Planctomycetia bacterium]|nr:excinuclease ABC subunit UvrA [Planctomycetia bacterium]
MAEITVRGAREHNLRDVNLTLPWGSLVCFTGVSGSGKSSLAFDTLYAEGQRRYIESFSSYARQFLGQLPKPNVDQITGLAPAISISQKGSGQNTRSTVGTITEIYDYLRVLFARVAVGYCPKCHKPVTAQTRWQIFDRVRLFPDGTPFFVLAPVVRDQKGEHRELMQDLKKQGYIRARVDGQFVRLDDDLKLDRQMRHRIDVVIDRLVMGPDIVHRLQEAIEHAVNKGKGQMSIVRTGSPESASSTVPKFEPAEGEQDGEVTFVERSRRPAPSADAMTVFEEIPFSTNYACPTCHVNFEPPTPQMFSFNSPLGMCPHCQGLGFIHTFDPELLIPDATKSFQQGCVIPLGKWKDLGRWKRHIYQGVADTLERLYSLEKNHVLETAWEELDERVRHALLWGTGDLHITYTWRSGPSGHKWGGPFEGIVPRMLKQYHETGSRLQRAAMEKYMNIVPCGWCHGRRLNDQACAFKLETASDDPFFAGHKIKSLPELCDLPVDRLREFLSELALSENGQLIASELLKEIQSRIGFLIDVGLNYLSLGRTSPTLSGGEMQRIRLAGQIGSSLTGVLYVLDEPSIGLHPRDNQRLIDTLSRLRDLGNTVIVVEHDEDTMLAADRIVDFGPGPGVHGGQIVADGPVSDVLASKDASLTARYLLGEERIETPSMRRPVGAKKLIVRGACHNNLKNIDVEIPLGGIVCVTGVSGSGKSSLVNDILVEALRRDLNRGNGTPGKHRAIEGMEHLDKLIAIDQTPIGRTPRSNPSTYIKLFDEIRRLFAELPDSKIKGFSPGRFSFNVPGGRCEACEGNGAQKKEMDFLADLWVTCPVCEGKRFNKDTLSVRFKGCSIDQILEMDVESAMKLFENIPKILHPLKTLYDVGLGYMKLGQPSPTLSGGEAQRIKLARELVKKSTGKTLYLLDEPTTGLHFADIKLLLDVLKRFADAGNTVLIVEHNLDVVKTADWVIDLGPEGGEAGGELIVAGTPEEVARCKASHTGRSLAEFFKREKMSPAKRRQQVKAHERDQANRNPVRASWQEEGKIIARDVCEHNLQNVSVAIDRNAMTVCTGPSGSGKSSLAMDTIFAEGQRRYVESLSSYARQFLGQMAKPKVGQILGISPAIAIEQKAAGHSPRSTVGTVTEIHDYLRVLFARLGTMYCPECDIPVGTQSTDEMIARIMLLPPNSRVLLTAPVKPETPTDFDRLGESLLSQGYLRIRIDGETCRVEDMPKLDRRRRHDLEVVIDRVNLDVERDSRLRARIAGSVEAALSQGHGVLHVVHIDETVSEPQWRYEVYSRHYSCEKCGRGFEPLTPHHFSFNSPLGWCPHCEGLGTHRGSRTTSALRDPKLTLAQGVMETWPQTEVIYRALLNAFCRQSGVPKDLPFEQMDARFRRMIFHGTGDRWFSLTREDMVAASSGKASPEKRSSDLTGERARNDSLLEFQFKGLYPAMDEAARLSPSYRGRLEFQTEEVECSVCFGSRLRDDVSAVRFHNETIDQLCRKPLNELLNFFRCLTLSELERAVAGDLIEEITKRLGFLVDVGLDYLTLSRPAPTLSGGESQRIRLAAQIGSGLTGVLYVLDEPTIGLHPRDNRRLIQALQKLRDLGNTLLVVEHDRDVIENSDKIIDFGPRAGTEGGLIVASGTPEEVAATPTSVTGPYLCGTKAIPIPRNRRIHAVTEFATQQSMKQTTTEARKTARSAKSAIKKTSGARTAVKRVTGKQAVKERPAEKTKSRTAVAEKAAVAQRKTSARKGRS